MYKINVHFLCFNLLTITKLGELGLTVNKINLPPEKIVWINKLNLSPYTLLHWNLYK